MSACRCSAEPASSDGAQGVAAIGDAILDEPPPLQLEGWLPALSDVPHNDVLGHVVMSRPARSLRAFARFVMPSEWANEVLLRRTIALQLEERGSIADRIDLSVPLGCAWVKLEDPGFPLVCGLGYHGGVVQALADLGAKGRQASPSADQAHYRFHDVDVFIAGIGSHVMLSNHPEAFGVARAYLEQELIGRTAIDANDFELVVYPSDAIAHHRPQIEGFLRKLGRYDDADDHPMAASQATMHRLALETARELARVSFEVQIGTHGLAVGWTHTAVAGSPVDRDPQVQAMVPEKLIGRLPESSVLALAVATSWDDLWGGSQAAAVRRAYAELAHNWWPALDPVRLAEAVESLLATQSAGYEPAFGVAVVETPSSSFGAMLVARGRDSTVARDAWRQWAHELLRTGLGSGTEQMLALEFSTHLDPIHRVEVDRLTLAPTKAARERLRERIPNGSQWEYRTAGFRLTLQRFELDQHVAMIASVGDPDPFVEQAIGGIVSERNVRRRSGFDVVMTRTQGMSATAIVDMPAILRRFDTPPGSARGGAGPTGSAANDAYIYWQEEQGGIQRSALVLSAELLESWRRGES